MNNLFKPAFFIILASAAVTAQARRPKKPSKSARTPAVVTVATPTPTPTPAPADTSIKRNERPVSAANANHLPDKMSNDAGVPIFFYEFTRPGFTFSRVLVEHDETGRGAISFQKDGNDETITDPISLSTATLEIMRDAFTALNFLESTESYQTTRDYSNMGNIRITVKRDGRERTVKYNWSDNKHAKALMDEYRRIGNEYIWRFEITSARQNQPLLTPSLMDSLDSYLKRSEISDPPHLLPFLAELSTDERLPLMARNHAAKLIKQIEKKQAGKK